MSPILSARGGMSAGAYGWGAIKSEGLILTPRTLPITFVMTGFQKGGSSTKWLIGNGSTSIATSTDGITWTTATANTALEYRVAAKPGGNYVTASGSAIRYSSDGITWTSASPYWTGPMTWLRYWGGSTIQSFVQKFTSSSAASSSSGTVWNNRPGTTYTSYDQASDGNMSGMPGYGTAQWVYTNNANWTNFLTSALPATKNWISAAYDSINGKFVVLDDSGTGAYSSNGTSWTQITVPTLSGYTYAQSSDGGGGVFAFGGTDGYLYSTDGIVFKKISMPSGDYYFQYDSSYSYFLMMKLSSTTYYTAIKP